MFDDIKAAMKSGCTFGCWLSGVALSIAGVGVAVFAVIMLLGYLVFEVGGVH